MDKMTHDIQELSEATRNFLVKPAKMLIGGKWLDSQEGGTFETINPSDGETIKFVSEGRAADIDLAVGAARKAFDEGPWSRMKPDERERLLHQFADLIEANADELAELEALDNGKAKLIARHVDIALAIDCFRYMAGWPTKLTGETIPLSTPFAPGANFFAYTQREPVGVVGQIIPWNFPILMAAWKLAPALAAGCTVVLKPAEETPLTALRLGELIMEAGFPDGVVNIVPGFGETAGAALAAHQAVDKIAFTGSTEVGKLILQAAAGNLKKVSLELGGKSPTVVFADADMDVAIPGAASAAFFNHGQTCCAGTRLYVEESAFERVVEGVSEVASNMSVGAAFDEGMEIGPLISQKQLDRVHGYIEEGFKEGARATAGGSRIDRPGYFVEPTVMVDTEPNMKVVKEEIFGPVLVAMPFSDPGEIGPLANDTEYGLAASVWSRDINKIHKIVPKIKAGTIWVNCHNTLDSALPFGGYKQSGWGRELGKSALDMYTETKSVCMQIG